MCGCVREAYGSVKEGCVCVKGGRDCVREGCGSVREGRGCVREGRGCFSWASLRERSRVNPMHLYRHNLILGVHISQKQRNRAFTLAHAHAIM